MDVRWITLLCVTIECVLIVEGGLMSSTQLEKVPCEGTSNGLHASNRTKRYEDYIKRYTNCTYVNGNLEIVFLDEKMYYNLSFLHTIKEVEGYVLLVGIYTNQTYLDNLRLIRGTALFKKRYSLYVSLIYRKGSTFGLENLGFTSLHEISHGNVLVYNNTALCHYNINWQDLLLTPETQSLREVFNSTKCIRQCHPSCPATQDGKVYCWGPGANQCQKMVKLHCAPHCDNGCYGDGTRCCHKECAAGCTGDRTTDCWSCRNFFNDGQCLESCPSFFRYDKRKAIYVPDPVNGRLAYGSICLKECPKYLIQQKDACVASCSPGYYEKEKEKVCVECTGACPKTCQGFTEKYTGEYFLHGGNIERFRGCTVMENNLVIIASSFIPDPHMPYPVLTSEQLEVLENVHSVKGSVMLQGLPANITSLSFLRNLQKVYGRQPFPAFVLLIMF